MREIELIVAGVQIGEEVETLIQRAVGLGIGFVDLVQNHNGAQPQRQRLGGYEFGLRHRPFGGVHQQHHAIDHRQDAFNLAAEIGVAGRIDDIDPRAFPLDRGGLGQNGDPAFALQIVAVHRTFGHGLIFPERAGLLEQFVHQCGFAVIDVSDDRDIAQVHDISLCAGVGPADIVLRCRRPELSALNARRIWKRGESPICRR